jgi:peptide/nickel transport system permease protein
MLAFTLRRAIQAIGVMIAVGDHRVLDVPLRGDPVNQIVSLDTPAAEREAVRKSLGLDDPVALQFARYFGNAAQFKVRRLLSISPAGLESLDGADAGDAGTRRLRHRFRDGVRYPDGGLFGAERDTFLAKVFQAVSLIGISLPTFLIGIC